MVLYIFLPILFLLLIIPGIIILHKILFSKPFWGNEEPPPSCLVFCTKNRENSIEYYVRLMAWQMKNALSSSAVWPKELVVIDLDSDDKTFLILKKLAEKYPFVHPMSKDEFIHFIDNL